MASAGKSMQSEPEPDRTLMQRVNLAINGNIERAFYHLGRAIARRPLVTIVLSFIWVAVFGSGVSQLESETRGDKLWLPNDTEAVVDNAFVTEIYPRFGRFEQFYFERVDEASVLTPEAFDRMYEIHQMIIFNTTWVNVNEEEGENLGQIKVPWLPDEVVFTDVCLSQAQTRSAPTPDACLTTNPLQLFGYDPSRWASTDLILEVLNDDTKWDRSFTPPGFVVTSVIGDLDEDTSGKIVDARVMSFSYFLAGNETYEEAQQNDPAAFGWEMAYLEDLRAAEEETPEYTLAIFATRSFDDEFGGTIEGDLQLLQVAIGAITVFTIVAMSDYRNGCVGSRVCLALGGLLNVALAIVACYGFGSYAGLLFTPLQNILPFIMIGIGVDGMFVLQGALDMTDKSDSLEERMGHMMSHAGVSVTVASLTNFAAFLIGSNTSLPALKSFSLYAALGLLFNLILQITFFSAIMYYDMKRSKSRRLDVICCVKTSAPENPGILCGAFGAGKPEEGITVMIMRKVGQLLTFWPVKIVVVVMWIGLLTAGIVGTSQMYVDADINSFLPTGSYLKDWLAVTEDHFTTTGAAAALYFRSTEEVPVEFGSPEVVDEMLKASTRMKELEVVNPDTFSSWLEALTVFKQQSGGSLATEPDAFYTDLRSFLATPFGARFRGDIKWVNEEDVSLGILSHRFNFNWKFIDGTIGLVNAMQDTRDAVKEIPPPLGTNAFAFGADFLQIEQYASVGREAFTNVALAFAMIAVIVILLLANPVASVLTFLCVASAIIELVGFLFFFGFRIDSVTVIFIVISLGLAVDYSVHVAHGFLACREADINQRLVTTLAETGSAVVMGALSTLVAAICLAFSGSYVFLTFCYALITIVLAGALQGLVILPVLLSIFKPASHVEVLTKIVE